MMRKVMAALVICLMFITTGCPDKQSPKGSENKMQVMKIDMKAAKEFMNNYMRHVMKRDVGAMRAFYGPKMKLKIKDVPQTSNPHPVGYKLEGGESKENTGEFKLHIYSGYTGSPYFSDDEFKYTVTMENGKMFIENIEKGKTIEIYLNEKDNQVYKREGDKLRGDAIITLKDLPYYVIPKESSSPEQKYSVPRKKFGPLALSPDGKSVVVSSFDTNSFIGLLSTEETKETMAEQGGKQQGPGGGGGEEEGGGQGKEQSQGGKEKNKAANGTLKTVDFFFNTKINIIDFSPDGKHFAVEYTPSTGPSQILIYKGKEGERADITADRRFRPDRFALSNPYFPSENEMVFTVTPIVNATKEEEKYKGDWLLDLEKGKLTQIQ